MLEWKQVQNAAVKILFLTSAFKWGKLMKRKVIPKELHINKARLLIKSVLVLYNFTAPQEKHNSLPTLPKWNYILSDPDEVCPSARKPPISSSQLYFTYDTNKSQNLSLLFSGWQVQHSRSTNSWGVSRVLCQPMGRRTMLESSGVWGDRRAPVPIRARVGGVQGLGGVSRECESAAAYCV